MSTVAANGYAGIQITPRWASNIYYNVSYHSALLDPELKLTSSSVTTPIV
jgi:hypothetical protein